ncbi:hypothetical protein D3C73_815980 [compost metagenome]
MPLIQLHFVQQQLSGERLFFRGLPLFALTGVHKIPPIVHHQCIALGDGIYRLQNPLEQADVDIEDENPDFFQSAYRINGAQNTEYFPLCG